MRTNIMIYTDNLKNRFQSVLRRKFLIAGVFLLLFLQIVLFLTPSIASAESSMKKIKTVTSVQIKEGDSLWSLAKQFYTSECGKFSAYIEEIKRSNGMSSDVLYAESYVIIPYYITK